MMLGLGSAINKKFYDKRRKDFTESKNKNFGSK